jgi:small-conductance mechanosensitive channel
MWRSTSDWLAAHYVQIIVAVGAGVLIYLALAALRQFGKRWRGAYGDPLGYANVLGRAVARTSHFFMVMVAAKLVAGYADPPAALFKTVAFLFTIAAVLQAAIWAREIILGLIERKTLAEDGQGETLANAMGLIRILVTFALFAIATIVVLDNLGVNVTGLVAGLGIGGIAIGLAAQGIFSDLFAALSIIFDKPFRRGDTIQFDSENGKVEQIGLKTTRLRSVSGEQLIMGNGELLKSRLRNYKRMYERRAVLQLDLEYSTDASVVERVPGILKQIIEAQSAVRFERSHFAGFMENALRVETVYFVLDPDYTRFMDVQQSINLAILKRFNAEKIQFAFPTRTVELKAPEGLFTSAPGSSLHPPQSTAR